MTMRSGAAAPTSAKSTRAKNGSPSMRRARADVSFANWRRAVKRSTSAESWRISLGDSAVGRTRSSSQASARMARIASAWLPASASDCAISAASRSRTRAV